MTSLTEHMAAWYHGTGHELAPGDRLTPEKADELGRVYDARDEHIFFTDSPAHAATFALGATNLHNALWPKDAQTPHVYQVEPEGEHEEDPNLPGLGGRRTMAPLRVVRKVSLLEHMAAWYHASPEQFSAGDMLEPGHERAIDNFLPGLSEHVHATNSREWARELAEHRLPYGSRHVYEVEPTGDYEPDTFDTVSGRSVKSVAPWRVLREANLLEHFAVVENPTIEGFLNPYHGIKRFSGRPEWSHTWFHGTRGTPEFGERGGDRDVSERMKMPPEERMHGMGWPQPNQLLGVHFSPLHEIAHKFAPSVSSQPTAIAHARLNFRNPAHFPTEDHLNIAIAAWGQQHYPHWHNDKLNSTMGWNYSDQEGTRRDFTHPPAYRPGGDYADNHPFHRFADSAQSLLTWHPHLPEILKGFRQHLEDQGHHGITYGNDLEGPYITGSTKGGEEAMKYIDKRSNWPTGHPYSISAIAQPEDIQTTHVEHIAPWREEPKAHERTWDAVRDQDEPDEMKDRVMAYHRMHGGIYPSGGEREASLTQHMAITQPYKSSEDRVYLRFGDWHHSEQSRNYVTGFPEAGVSVYELNHHGDPIDPDEDLLRWHEHNEHCEPDCDLDQWNDEYTNDTREEMRDRVQRAEHDRYRGEDRSDTPHLVRGRFAGIGHDGEPLLNGVRKVGDWIDHRHLFIPGASKHRLARDPGDEGYEPPKLHHEASLTAHFAVLDVHDYKGTVGDNSHITRNEYGRIPTAAIAHMPGMRGEVPGEHRNMDDADEWPEFKEDIRRNGITDPIFINVFHGKNPMINEGNHRRDAAVELGLSHVPAEIRYFGHAEHEGTVLDRMRRTAARQMPVTEIGPLYHGTTAERAGRILEHGFEGGKDRHEDVIHLTPHPELALSYAEGRVRADGGGTPAVLKVDKVRGVSATETGYMNPAKNRAAGAHYMDKGPEVLVLDPSAVHGITRHASSGGVYYHGTAYRFKAGDMIEPGYHKAHEISSPEHVYLAASDSVARTFGGQAALRNRAKTYGIYQVEPTGPVEPDPDGPGWRSKHPLRVVRLYERGSAPGDPNPWWNQPGTGRGYKRHASSGDRYVTCDQGHRHWGAYGAAGLLVRHTDPGGTRRYLLQHRSETVQHGGTWSTPGGALHAGETPEQGAMRESTEEMGRLHPEMTHAHTYTDDHGGWRYHTVVMDSPERFEPPGHGGTSWETADHGWFTDGEIKAMGRSGKLHPGFAESWDQVRSHGQGPKTAVRGEYFRADERPLVWNKRAWPDEPGQEPVKYFFHGTRSELQKGDLIHPPEKLGIEPEVYGEGLQAKTRPSKSHVYFTHSQGWASQFPLASKREGYPHVYVVEPTGAYSRDPHDKELGFPGMSYQSRSPLRVIDEVNPRVVFHEHELGYRRPKEAAKDGPSHGPRLAAREHVTYYHGTSDEAARSIESQGLRPSTRAPLDITVAKNYDSAYYHAVGRVRGWPHLKPAVVTLRIPAEHEHLYISPPGRPHAALARVVPPDYLSVDYEPAEPGMPEHIRRQMQQEGSVRFTRRTAVFRTEDLPPKQRSIFEDYEHPHEESYKTWSRRFLDVAKTAEPGTHVWRGERRPVGEDLTKATSTGMHWTADPDMVIKGHTMPDTTVVVWQGQVDHPGQHFPRSHPMWFGRGRSLDTEAEIRFKPGAQVKLHGAYVWHHKNDPESKFAPGQEYTGMGPVPSHPERNDPNWEWVPMHGKTITIKHSGHGAADYSEFGVHREAAAEVQRGMMIAIVPPGDVLDGLIDAMKPISEKTESRDNMHLTVLYLGKTGDHIQSHRDKLPELVSQWGKTQEPFTAKVQGAGTFANGDEHVLHALVDIPGGHHMRASLEEFLQGHGISFPQEHNFTPHITLAYADHRMRFLPKIEPREWPVDSVWYVQAGRWQEIPLGRWEKA